MSDAATEAPTTLIGTQDSHPNPLVRVLNAVPRLLASKIHVGFLFGLGVFLVLLPLAGVHVSSDAELIGGNYTNVTSDLGACIAAGGTVHIIKRNRDHRKQIADLHAKLDAVLARSEGHGSAPATTPRAAGTPGAGTGSDDGGAGGVPGPR